MVALDLAGRELLTVIQVAEVNGFFFRLSAEVLLRIKSDGIKSMKKYIFALYIVRDIDYYWMLPQLDHIDIILYVSHISSSMSSSHRYK